MPEIKDGEWSWSHSATLQCTLHEAARVTTRCFEWLLKSGACIPQLQLGPSTALGRLGYHGKTVRGLVHRPFFEASTVINSSLREVLRNGRGAPLKRPIELLFPDH